MTAQTCAAASARTATTDRTTTDRTVTARHTGVSLDLPERRAPVVRRFVVGVAALLAALLAATLVVALAGTALGTLLAVAALLAAPFALFAYVLVGAGAAVEALSTPRY